MENFAGLKAFFEEGYKNYRQGISIDCAIFGFEQDELKVLLSKNAVITKWSLPGGFVRKTENLEEAARRTTVERTGIDHLFFRQFKTFGDPNRNIVPGIFDEEKFEKITGFQIPENTWLKEDAISIGYYAVTNISESKPEIDIFSTECKWFNIEDVPPLAFDHNQILQEALQTLKIHLYHYPIGKNLLPALFTLKEIKNLYEILSGKHLHASNFPNKLISLGLIEKTEEKRNIGAHRAPTYYTFNEEVYENMLQDGFVLV
ncbi:MAG: hypothetical protein RI995_737 [Bacteroidota bacterium]|jgi:ADP-ribose pyrophosphatase YjhB (NUDIX family)